MKPWRVGDVMGRPVYLLAQNPPVEAAAEAFAPLVLRAALAAAMAHAAREGSVAGGGRGARAPRWLGSGGAAAPARSRVGNMKPCSEMLLEVTVYCSKVRDQRGREGASTFYRDQGAAI